MGQFNLVFKKVESKPIYPEIPIIEDNEEDIEIANIFAEAEARIANRNNINELLKRPFAFITGPAGSGKTFTIN